MAVIYRCDQCKEESEDHAFLVTIDVPEHKEGAKPWSSARNHSNKSICPECKDDLIAFLHTDPSAPRESCVISWHAEKINNWNEITSKLDGKDRVGLTSQVFVDQYYLDAVQGLIKLRDALSLAFSVSSPDGSAELGQLQNHLQKPLVAELLTAEVSIVPKDDIPF